MTLTFEATGKLPRYQGVYLILYKSMLIEELTCVGRGMVVQTDTTSAGCPACC